MLIDNYLQIFGKKKKKFRVVLCVYFTSGEYYNG